MRPAVTLVAASILLAVLSAVPARAQSAENVAVVINEASQASVTIGERYVRARNVPAPNVIRIKTSADEEIPRVLFEATIEGPIGRALARNSLQDRVLYIVLTKGIPLRIAGLSGVDGTVASVDSELTLLYRRLTGAMVPVRGHVDNPFYLGTGDIASAQRFSHRLHDIYLVTRLDGFSVDDALALIDRAQSAVPDGRIVLDQRATPDGRVGDKWLEQAAARIGALGFADRVLLDTAATPARGVSPVLGYYSWGSNDPANRVRRVGMTFSPGALAATFVSTDARTLQTPPDAWMPSDWQNRGSFGGSTQSLVGDLIREGATGVAGQVAEPYLQSTVRPDILFPSYLAGFNLVEAFYLGMPHLSWQTVVIGDPLCAPFVREPLGSSSIEEPIDPQTGMPGIFSRRRRAEVQRGSMATSEAVTALLLSETRSIQGDAPGARRALEEATKISPSLVAAQLRLAEIYEKSGEADLAADRYRLVLTAQPANLMALNNLAYHLAVRQKSPAEGRVFALRAFKLAQGDPKVVDTLAWTEHLLGNNAEAARLIGPAVEKSSGSGEIHLHAAVIYAADGKLDVATAQLNEALRLDPTLADSDEVKALRPKLVGK